MTNDSAITVVDVPGVRLHPPVRRTEVPAELRAEPPVGIPMSPVAGFPKSLQRRPLHGAARTAGAIVYCEGSFAAVDGKTANGLVRHSEKYRILSVIDSEQAGLDAGMVLDGIPNGIPICRDLADCLGHAADLPGTFILGMAPSDGMLSPGQRGVVLTAMGLGMDIVSGLHEFLSEDPEFAAVALQRDIDIVDIRKPPAKKDMHLFSGRIAEVDCPRIAVLGTDCAIGKRTTATILTRVLNDHGIKAVLVTTGQTGLMQGARYGVALDAIPSQFCAGEMEAVIVAAYEEEAPDVIVIEGQGALSHPAFSTSSFILRGGMPHAVILQHAPGRTHRCDFEAMSMPTPASEIRLLQSFADTKVIGLTINHEAMTGAEVEIAIRRYQAELGIPATDVLTHPADQLLEMVVAAFPDLLAKLPGRQSSLRA